MNNTNTIGNAQVFQVQSGPKTGRFVLAERTSNGLFRPAGKMSPSAGSIEALVDQPGVRTYSRARDARRPNTSHRR